MQHAFTARQDGENCRMYISAKADYALRALITLVVEDRPLTADALARRQGSPPTPWRTS
jgi:DNA-binding IscR family transcriptional regulator